LGPGIFFPVILVLQLGIDGEAGGNDGENLGFSSGRGASSAFCVLGKLAVFAINL
jgi:hypothetical protein